MRVWIVNPFDPLPGDPEQPGHCATLAVLLRDAGHDVTWWTASFSHRFKRPVEQDAIRAACRPLGIEARFIDTPAYLRNVSFQRIRSHRVYARSFEREARRAARPDVVIASNPPLEGPDSAGRVARSLGARLILDVQDIWIDSFRRMLLVPVRWAWPLVLRPWIRANRSGFARADAAVGVAGGYADEPKRYGRMTYRREVVPLGIDLKSFDQAVRGGRCLLPERRAGEIRVI